MKYLILQNPSELYAAAISQWMWALTRPATDDSTKYYCGWVVHPDGRVALELPEHDSQPIHPDADARSLVDTIRAVITANEAALLEQQIESSRGERVDIADMIPASVQSNVLTREQAQDAGWFEEIL